MHDRDALLQAVDLRALGDELLGGHHGTDRSPTWRCPNPQHAQTGRTPPVSIFSTRTGEQRWRCHGCGTGGTAIDLLCQAAGMDVREALDDLSRRAGHHPSGPPTWAQPPDTTIDPPELTELQNYVDECADRLWTQEGRTVRHWLTGDRALPEAVLRRNRIGADLGPRRQRRPSGVPKMGGAVLPAIRDGGVRYAQVRVLHPRADRPKYLNPSAHVAPNPRLVRFRPPTRTHSEVLITEGALDALSANAAGYRAVAVLGAGYPDATTARELALLRSPLVIAFDADDAGRRAAHRLHIHLHALLRPATILELGHGDLNDALTTNATDWSRHLTGFLNSAITRSGDQRPLSR